MTAKNMDAHQEGKNIRKQSKEDSQKRRGDRMRPWIIIKAYWVDLLTLEEDAEWHEVIYL